LNQPIRIISGVAVVAIAGYLGIYRLPEILDQLHQIDIRETARETGSPPPVSTPSSPQITASDLACGSEDAKKLVAQVISKNPPEGLLDAAGGNLLSNSKFRNQIHECYNSGQATDEHSPCVVDVEAAFDKFTNSEKAIAVYALKNIRLEARNATTGAIECNATVHVDTGPDGGTADEEVSYKLEKMEDGGLHIEMAGLK
jgi:hypothetical protein